LRKISAEDVHAQHRDNTTALATLARRVARAIDPRTSDTPSSASSTPLADLVALVDVGAAPLALCMRRRAVTSRSCTLSTASSSRDAMLAVDARSTLECLPHGCYVLRGALDARAREEATRVVGEASSSASVNWMTRAAANDHPTIIASRARGRGRNMACVRACGLRRCSGACGGDVGAMTEDPVALFALARACATRAAALDDDDGVLRSAFGDDASDDPFEASHFWALVYGAREDGDERRRREKMSAHLDRPAGWVVSVTLGRSARMTIGQPPEKGDQYGEFASHRALDGQSAETAVEVVVNDGDAVFFRGDRVFHSVDGFVSEPPERRDWARSLLPEGAEMGDDGYTPGRLALLFREERETQGRDAR